MKEQPILLIAPEVRAILAGTKTQTRRVMKPQPRRVDGGVPFGDGPDWAYAEPGSVMIRCPYGKRGDRLWVRETWNGPLFNGELPADHDDSKYETPDYCVYRASGDSCEYIDADDNVQQRWRSSTQMPRWASRILLEVLSVRVERLNDITEGDAQAEGPPKNFVSWRDNFCALWQQINGDGSWAANPWVWVIEFKRVQA